ncbi:hypothetical protein [Novosphingobium sp. AP12]|uniref:hypothetical protein n=1 Tax=Novosphingobium sp. AP12 TaxID=1144305 RepID=UPI000271E212|nr:hypothetical protein [Novosphingobium sp. AP12]EJL33391.1 hypothetical protein PMI02_01140 [Novosphingobium sp. AP12]
MSWSSHHHHLTDRDPLAAIVSNVPLFAFAFIRLKALRSIGAFAPYPIATPVKTRREAAVLDALELLLPAYWDLRPGGDGRFVEGTRLIVRRAPHSGRRM